MKSKEAALITQHESMKTDPATRPANIIKVLHTLQEREEISLEKERMAHVEKRKGRSVERWRK